MWFILRSVISAEWPSKFNDPGIEKIPASFFLSDVVGKMREAGGSVESIGMSAQQCSFPCSILLQQFYGLQDRFILGY